MEYILLEKKNRIAYLTVNRPGQLNALNSQTLAELGQAIEQIERDGDLRAVILTGAGGKAFVAGADIGEMAAFDREASVAFSKTGNQVFRRLEKSELPVIAAVAGYALGGGCELAMACDIRIAAENAVFSQPETGLSVIPGFGGTQRLARIVGEAMAKLLIFTGDRIDASEALRIGLVNRVVPVEKLLPTCEVIANKLMRGSRSAIAAAKAAIDFGGKADMDCALAFESRIFGECFETAEQKQAMQAFLNKSKK